MAIDPKPYSRIQSIQVDDGGGNTHTEHVRDDSQFYYLAALGEAAQARDLDAVAKLLAQNNGYCQPHLVPDLPDANPMTAER